MQRKQRRLILVALAAGVLAWTAHAATRESIDNARATMEKWVETRRVISKEKQDWALGREMLNERVELLEREIASLREKIDQAKESISDADKKRVELVDENDKLKSAAGMLAGIVTSPIADAIAILKNEKVASFVLVPLKVQ